MWNFRTSTFVNWNGEPNEGIFSSPRTPFKEFKKQEGLPSKFTQKEGPNGKGKALNFLWKGFLTYKGSSYLKGFRKRLQSRGDM